MNSVVYSFFDYQKLELLQNRSKFQANTVEERSLTFGHNDLDALVLIVK